MSDETITIRDVARAAGVSPATVSRVINGSSGVRPDKESRVRAAIDQLGYQLNHLARDLSRGMAVTTVGVLVPQLADEFTGTVVTGIERELRSAEYHMLCSLSHADPGDEATALRVFLERRVSGLILVTPSLSDTSLLELNDRQIPLVLVNRRLPELAPNCLHIDNRAGGELATRHLLEMGRRNLVHIAGPLNRQEARDRLEGFFATLSAAGVPRDEQRYVECGYVPEEGRQAMLRLLQRGDVDGVFAANDLLAAGALLALREVGLRVPEDVSVVGFDDRSIAPLLAPALTTIHYPMLEAGERAARHLIRSIEGQENEPLPLLEPRLVTRDSTSPA